MGIRDPSSSTTETLSSSAIPISTSSPPPLDAIIVKKFSGFLPLPPISASSNCTPTTSSSSKLKKKTHPPPSYKPPPTTELSFVALSPPSPGQSHFPYSFHNNIGSNGSDSRSDFSRPSSNSLPPTARPTTVLTMNSTTPLISHWDPAHDRQTEFQVAAPGMPARKLTKPRKTTDTTASQYASLSSSPTMNHSSSANVFLPELPRRRATIGWNVTWSFRRRKNVSVEEVSENTVASSRTKSKSKKFTLEPEGPDFDIDHGTSIHIQSRSPSPPRRKVYDLDPTHDQLPLHPEPLGVSPGSRPRPQPISHSQPLTHELNSFGAGFPSVQRRNSAPVSRRWTLAMAMTNTDMDDESFVRQVEAMRRASVFLESDSPPLSDDGEDINNGLHYGEASDYDEDNGLSLEDASSAVFYNAPPTSEIHTRAPSSPSSATFPHLYAPLPFSPPTAENEWSSALHALLTTRDLLKTERNYLASLLVLLDSSPCASITSLHLSHANRPKKSQLSWPRHPPAPLMHSYLLSLIGTSHTLIARFESDPSVMGAATALVENEEEVERVFVGWCGVVGGWFVAPKDGTRARRRLSKTRYPDSPSSPAKSGPAESPKRPKSLKSDSGHINLSSSSLRLSNPPALPELGLFAPVASPISPPNPTANGNHSSLKDTRAGSVKPLSIITPDISSPLFTPTSPKPIGSASKTQSDQTSEPTRYDTPRSLPPLPPSGEKATVDNTSSITRSSSTARLLGLVGVGRKCNSEISLTNGKTSKSRSFKIPTTSPPSSEGNQVRSKNLLFGNRRRSTSEIHKDKTREDSKQEGPGLQRTMSEYWRKSVLPVFPSSSTKEVNTSLSPPPVPSLPPLPRSDSAGEKNGQHSGTNTATTSSGHSDEGFYSAQSVEGFQTPPRTTLSSPVAMASPTLSPALTSVSEAGGVVFGPRNDQRVYSVRDLAILPVQRVTRYALLYRDLLNHTPASSPCRPILEEAVQVSHRIAQKCNRAQGNAQLLQTPPRGRR